MEQNIQSFEMVRLLTDRLNQYSTDTSITISVRPASATRSMTGFLTSWPLWKSRPASLWAIPRPRPWATPR